MRQGQKKKKRNVKGRKSPSFANMIDIIIRDSLVTLEEMMEKSPTKKLDEESGRIKATYDSLPDDCTVVDTLGGNFVFKDERLFRHIDKIAMALREFDDAFFDIEDGVSVIEMRVDKKNRVWGSQEHVLGLAYVAIAMGMAGWTQPREEWLKNKDKLPRIKFTLSKGHEEMNDEQETRVEDHAAH